MNGRATHRSPQLYYSGDGWETMRSMTADEVVDGQPDDWVKTSLVDQRGQPIYRRRPTVKFGFQAW